VLPVSPPHTVGPAVGGPTLPPLTEMPPGPDLSDSALPAPRPVPATPGPAAPVPPPNPLPKLPDAGAGVGKPATAGDAMFTPTGTTVTVPRFQPVTLPARGTTGAAIPPPLSSPSSAVPPLPPGGGGIPPTLPVPGPVVTESPPQ